jgi:hypothetical protein
MPAARVFLRLIVDFVAYLGLLIRPRKGHRHSESLSTAAARIVPRAQSRPAANRSRDAQYVGSALKVIQRARCAHCGSTEDVKMIKTH